MSPGARIRGIVDWGAGEHGRRLLERSSSASEERCRTCVCSGLLFGSLAPGDVRGRSDLDLVLIVDARDPFVERCVRFYAIGVDDCR